MLARIDHDELDSGRGRADAERLCVVTRKVRPVSELIRFVVGPGGEIVPDIKKIFPAAASGSQPRATRWLRRSAATPSQKVSSGT